MKTLQANYQSVVFILFLLLPFSVNSQVSITPVRDFNFGTFYPGNSGGTISISANGSRSSTGDIVLLTSGISVSQAIFEIEAPVNTTISVLTEQNAAITGSNGGSMILEITESDLGSPFTTSQARSTIQFSGELTVRSLSTNPPGAYHGTVSITFNYE